MIPSWLTPTLIVAICVLLATLVGVIINYLHNRKDKPHLRVEMSSVIHTIRYEPDGGDQIAGTELIADFSIGNTGADTDIYNIAIKCKPSGQPYQNTEKVQSPRAIKVKRGVTKPYSHQFYIPKRRVSESPLNCTFFLIHTYGKKKVKARSTYHGGL